MFSTSRWAALAAVIAFSAGCRSTIDVRTIAAPDVGLGNLHTFRMLPGPARRDGQPATGTDDPMITNSIANRALHEQIIKAFEARGYTRDDRNADFGVAFYATAREKLDVTMWDYGYPVNPGWPTVPRPVQGVTQYTEGSVVIDVVQPRTRTLLWRGEGRAELSAEPADNVKQLIKVVDAIIDRFPHATARVVATTP